MNKKTGAIKKQKLYKTEHMLGYGNKKTAVIMLQKCGRKTLMDLLQRKYRHLLRSEPYCLYIDI